MANLWQRIVKQQMVEEHENDPKYQWATYAKVGWHRREDVAEALECHEEKVHALLKSAMVAKKIERREFVIWDKLNKELVKVVAYRERGRHAEEPAAVPASKAKPVRARRKPEAGMTVRSRRGNRGVIRAVGRGKCEIEWESGQVTSSLLAGFKKGDVRIEG